MYARGEMSVGSNLKKINPVVRQSTDDVTLSQDVTTRAN